MKYAIKTLYFNPILKVWEDEKTTPYFSPEWTSWGEYAKLIGVSQKA